MACVELKFDDGSTIAIDTIAAENEVADNMYQRSELDHLIYNAPPEYADLILNGDPEKYLKVVTEYKPFESDIAPMDIFLFWEKCGIFIFPDILINLPHRATTGTELVL